MSHATQLDTVKMDGPEVAILVNLIAPYRLPIYSRIGDRFRALVLVSASIEVRCHWDHVAAQLRNVEVRRPFGFTVPYRQKRQDGRRDQRYLQLQPGYLVDLLWARPRAVLSVEMGFRTLCALLYGTICRRPIWVWWGGTRHSERDVGRVRRAVRWLVARWARRWISYGQSSTQYLLDLGVPQERILQIQNCVDETLFSRPVQPALRLATGPRPVVLYVGQLIGRKGINCLLESAARLQRQGLVFSLLLVGDGPDKAALQAKVEHMQLQHVHFQAGQTPEQMPAWYRSADCMVFPTLEDVWGLVVNEALWCGTPVLSSIHAGCTEEIVPPENRFDPLDPDDFDRALRRAVEGKLMPADTTPLRTSRQVAEQIISDIERELGRTDNVCSPRQYVQRHQPFSNAG